MDYGYLSAINSVSKIVTLKGGHVSIHYRIHVADVNFKVVGIRTKNNVISH